MKHQPWTWMFLGLIAVGLVYAWVFRNAADDAFITFRYSRNLVEGIGPVWNPDQRVEGYTNFLWMLVMAAPIAMGIDPLAAAWAISLPCVGVSLFVQYRISLRLTGDAERAFLCWLPVACSHTLLFTSTYGLETALNGLLWTLVVWQVQGILDGSRPGNPAMLSRIGFTCGLATLCRMEAVILLALTSIALLTARDLRAQRLQLSLPSLWIGFLALVLPWLAWRYAYYGYWLPNTFYAKTAVRSTYSGLMFVLTYFLVSAAWVPALILGAQRRRKALHLSGFPGYAAGLVAVFVSYVVWAGGDYLEFRILVPVLPMFLMLPSWLLAQGTGSLRWLRVSTSMMVLAAFVWGQGNGRFFKIGQGNGRFLNFPRIDPLVQSAREDVRAPWFADQGVALGALLEHDSTVRIALPYAGAIPYYSRLYSIDLYGLNEPWDEFSGYPTGYGAGHAILATYPYIRSRQPHLISMRCDYVGATEEPRRYSLSDFRIAAVLHGATREELSATRIIELPVGGGFVEVCIYHRSHPRIEALIKNRSLRIYKLEDVPLDRTAAPL